VNKDTAVADIRVRLSIAGPTHYEFDNVIGLPVDGKFQPISDDDVVFLSPGESLTAAMGAAAAATNPSWISSWIDRA